jgi:hypothetical protein
MKQFLLCLVAILPFSCNQDRNEGVLSDSFAFTAENSNLLSYNVNDDWEVHIQYPQSIYSGENAVIHYAFKTRHPNVRTEKPLFTISSDNGTINEQYNDYRILLLQNCALGQVVINFSNAKSVTFNVINTDRRYYQYIDESTHNWGLVMYNTFVPKHLSINEETKISFNIAIPAYRRSHSANPILISGSANIRAGGLTFYLTPTDVGTLKIKVFNNVNMEFIVD